MNKPAVMLRWLDEVRAQPIPRDIAAKLIRGNRRADHALRIKAFRKNGVTYVGSELLAASCAIYRAQGVAA